MGNKLYVGNLPFSATDDSLREMFAQAGQVESARIITDRDTGRSKGFCRRCKARILFARDFTDGQSEVIPAAKLVLTCGQPNCGHRADYSNAKIARFQKI
ncbi:MAG: hypothetical protein DMG20_08580 [Acidobacteria bacterium]|nr:MAG: hypothetical protein DMG20_08580 [Acidobacteriota bacterium]